MSGDSDKKELYTPSTTVVTVDEFSTSAEKEPLCKRLQRRCSLRLAFWGVGIGCIVAAVLVGVALRVIVGYALRNKDGGSGDDDADLRWKASGRQIPGLTFKEEGSWKGPFFFVLGADTQLGLIDQMNNVTANPSWDEELRRLDLIISHLNCMNPKPKFFIICGDLVNAFPQNLPMRWERQGKDLKTSLLRLDSSIPVICVCGNHDIGNTPSSATVARYRGSFGDDYFSFWVGGSFFIVLNSQLYFDDSLVKGLSAAQEAWLDDILKSTSTQSPRHIAVFLHIPPFRENIDEPADYFNLALEKRKPLVNKLFNAGVSKIFAGHFHRNSGGFAFERRLEVIVNSAIGRVWAGKPGARIVKVNETDIQHEWFDLEQFPTNVEL